MGTVYASWYEQAKVVIWGVLADKGIPQESKLAEIDKRYPFGERAMHPYKMWLKARKQAAYVIERNIRDEEYRKKSAGMIEEYELTEVGLSVVNGETKVNIVPEPENEQDHRYELTPLAMKILSSFGTFKQFYHIGVEQSGQ